jgi:MFS transporter, PAT family, beta-lactamase induction signal transducer AmpG
VDEESSRQGTPVTTPTRTTRPPRPWHFFVLVLPYGASFGFVAVAFPFMARERGIAVDAIAAVVAAAFLPHAPKFLWAPVVDVTWSRKTWYLASLGLVSTGTFASMCMPIAPSSLRAFTAVVVVSQLGLTLMGMSIEGLLGRSVAPGAKGTAAGWFQAGSFVGMGIGGGAAIKLVARLGGPIAGAVIAVALGACALPLLLFDETLEPERRRLLPAARALGRDLLQLVRSPGGIAAVVICVSPIGSGAAGNLFGAIADEWHASRNLVVLTTGSFGNVVSGAGAAAGGWLAARAGPRSAYALAGALTAATGVAMAIAPHAAWAYALFTLTYQAFNGVAFAAFSAFAFEAAGTGAVATKYNVLASLANTAIAYTTRVDGAAHARWPGAGGRALLLTDAAMTCGGIAVLAIVVALTRRHSAGETRPRYP